jgi:hypothetical protein
VRALRDRYPDIRRQYAGMNRSMNQIYAGYDERELEVIAEFSAAAQPRAKPQPMNCPTSDQDTSAGSCLRRSQFCFIVRWLVAPTPCR